MYLTCADSAALVSKVKLYVSKMPDVALPVMHTGISDDVAVAMSANAAHSSATATATVFPCPILQRNPECELLVTQESKREIGLLLPRQKNVTDSSAA